MLGAKVSAELAWVKAKRVRLGKGADIETISSAFGADFPVNLGRKDATQPDPAGRFPDPNTASPQEIQVSQLLLQGRLCLQHPLLMKKSRAHADDNQQGHLKTSG